MPEGGGNEQWQECGRVEIVSEVIDFSVAKAYVEGSINNHQSLIEYTFSTLYFGGGEGLRA